MLVLNEWLTVAIGVGLFYLLIHPEKVRNNAMFLGACIAYVASVALLLIGAFTRDADANNAAAGIHIIGITTSMVFIFLGVSRFSLGVSAAAPPPAPKDDEGNG